MWSFLDFLFSSVTIEERPLRSHSLTKNKMANAAREALKNVRIPGGAGGFFGGAGALLGLGALTYGVNASLYNGICPRPLFVHVCILIS